MNNYVYAKTKGLHLYVTIDNFDELMSKEESSTRNIKKSLKLLNSFFVAIRRYVSQTNRFAGLFVEKITGNRMHLYIDSNEGPSENECMYELVNISLYSINTIECLNNEVGKLASLDNAVIKIGADYGEFRKFRITDQQNNIDEDTSIGFAANYACKLQIIANRNSVAISEDDYSYVDSKLKQCFKLSHNSLLSKYHDNYSDKYYIATLQSIRDLLSADGRYHFDENSIKDIANKINLGDMIFINETKKININNLSEKEIKKLNGITLMADIRNFTKKFNDDDSNLDEMSFKAYDGVMAMIKRIDEFEGTHIQVQGDKEVAIFSLTRSTNCGEEIKKSIFAALHIIDDLKNKQLDVGIGMDFGDIYAAKLDTSGKKSPVILGKTVVNANNLEDDCAGVGELVISTELYGLLKQFRESNFLCKYFNYRLGYYYTSTGFIKMQYDERIREQERDTKSKSYTGAYLK